MVSPLGRLQRRGESLASPDEFRCSVSRTSVRLWRPSDASIPASSRPLRKGAGRRKMAAKELLRLSLFVVEWALSALCLGLFPSSLYRMTKGVRKELVCAIGSTSFCRFGIAWTLLAFLILTAVILWHLEGTLHQRLRFFPRSSFSGFGLDEAGRTKLTCAQLLQFSLGVAVCLRICRVLHPLCATLSYRAGACPAAMCDVDNCRDVVFACEDKR